MERIDKQIVASGLGLLSVAGLGTGLAHADTVQRVVNKTVVSLAGQGEPSRPSMTTRAPLKIATAKVVATTQATPQKVTTEKSQVYEVQAGDSLWTIAKAQQVSVDALVASNQGSDLISAGQKLVIPTSDTSAQQPESAALSMTNAADLLDVNTMTSVATTADPAVAAPSEAALPEAQLTAQAAATTVTPAHSLEQKSVAPAAQNVVEETAKTASSVPTPAVPQPKSVTTSQKPAKTDTTPTTPATDTKTSISMPSLAATTSATGEKLEASAISVAAAPPVAQPVHSVSVQDVVALAQSLTQQNIPYVWGGESPAGFDCSGLVSYVFQQSTGRTLPHSSVAQEGYVQKKAVAEAQPGDLLFWGTPGASYHVAIYIGNQSYVTAPEPGETVRVEKISSTFMPSFAGQF